LEYIFRIPKEIYINSDQGYDLINITGGMTPSENKIYLYGWNCSPEIDYSVFYIWILEHEHIHALLFKYNISIDFHHILIDRIQKALNNFVTVDKEMWIHWGLK